MNKEKVSEILKDNFAGADISVEGDDGVHFSADIKWEGFNGLTRIKQHQLVNSVLEKYIISGELHALALKTRAKDWFIKINLTNFTKNLF